MKVELDANGYYGRFGGSFVPEILHKNFEELSKCYLEIINSEDFKEEFDMLLRD